MLKISFAALGLLMTGMNPSTAHAQVYQCDDPDGIHFSDRPCGPEIRIEDSSRGLGGPISAASLYQLEAKKHQRETRRLTNRLYDWRDREVAMIDRRISALESRKTRSANSLSGATRAAGIDQQIAALQQARSETIINTQGEVLRLLYR